MRFYNLVGFTLLFLLVLNGCKKNDPQDGEDPTLPAPKIWETVGNVNINQIVTTLCSDPQGNIYAAGFTDNNDKYYVLKWDGKKWSTLEGLRTNYCIYHLSSDKSGNIYASGSVGDAADTYYYIAKWDGTTWTDMGIHSPFASHIYSTTDKNGNLYAAVPNNFGQSFVYAHTGGTSWNNLGSLAPDEFIGTISADGNGKIYEVLNRGSLDYPIVAMFSNGIWSELPRITSDVNNQMFTSCTDLQGNLYVGGDLYDKTTKKFFVGKWDGSQWIRMSGLNGNVQSVCTDPMGNIYAAGSLSFNGGGNGFDVVKWDGKKWVALGAIGSKINIHALCSDPVGNIYAEGTFTSNYINQIKVCKK
ncbi:MAG TPA: hypothetical protein VK202_09275 [Bacteroidia bacterium]|nr:hypothetical protein [Bacteroidia bacterium]